MSSVNAKVVTFDDALTFTRASTATYFDKNGVLQSAAVDEPRFDHDPVTGEALGLLVEEGRTNQFAYSDFTGWTKQGADYTLSAVSAPDGTPTAMLVDCYYVEDTGGSHTVRTYQRADPVLAGDVITLSVFVKKVSGGADYVALTSDSGAAVYFNLASLTVVDDHPDGQLKVCSDGWVRCSATLTASVDDSSNNCFVAFTNRTSNVSMDPPPAGDEEFHIWGAQVEEGAFPTSYIPTNGAAVTRSADNIADTDISDQIGANGATVLFEYRAPVIYKSANPFKIIEAADPDNRLQFNFTSAGNARVYSRSNYVSAGISTSGRHRLAVSIGSGGLQCASDGTASSPAALDSDPGLFDTLRLAEGVESIHLLRLDLYPHEMTATELEGLTV